MKRFFHLPLLLTRQPVVLYLLIITLSLTACKKNNYKPGNGITGKWQWFLSGDGFGKISTPNSTGTSQTLVLNADSTYAFNNNNSVTDNGIFHISKKAKISGNGTDDIITFQTGKYPYSTYANIIALSNDTLSISTTFSWERSISKYVRSN